MAQPLFVLLVEIDLGAITTSGLKIAVTMPAATKGVAYVGQLAASGGTAPYTYAISAGSLPTGLSLNTSTGAITGTPSATGYFEFTAAVTDFASATASKVVAVTVSSGIAVSGGLALAEVGQAYSSGLNAVGGTPPYTWSIASGSLPTSLSINGSTGIISGTPTVANTFNFTVRATDSGSDAQDFPTSISVAASISLSGVYPSGVVGIAYSNALVTSGGVGPFTYSISSGSIDPGLSLSSTSGIISGTPTIASTYTFDITVLDSLGGSDTSSQSVIFSSAGGTGIVESVVPGNNISVDNTDPANPIVKASDKSPGCGFSNGGLSISGTLIDEVTIEYDGSIIEWTIVADAVGSVSIIVSHSTYTNYPTMTTLFTASLSSAQKNKSVGLTQAAISKGDVLRFSASGFSDITRCKINLDVVTVP